MHDPLRMLARGVAAAVCATLLAYAPRGLIEESREKRQRAIVAAAMAAGDCDAVQTLPGVHPKGSANEQRFVYRCWMEAGLREMDACIGMVQLADAASVRAIEAVLRRNEPILAPEGRWTTIDTSGACISALVTATGRRGRALRELVRDWSPAWHAWAEQPPELTRIYLDMSIGENVWEVPNRPSYAVAFRDGRLTVLRGTEVVFASEPLPAFQPDFFADEAHVLVFAGTRLIDLSGEVRDLGTIAAELDERARVFAEPSAYVIEVAGKGRAVIPRRE